MKSLRVMVCVGLLVLVPALKVGATETRISSMGGGEKRWTVDDETGSLLFPARLVLYPNVLYLDGGFGSAGGKTASALDVPYDAGFGFFYGLGESSVLGFHGSSSSQYVAPTAVNDALSWSRSPAPVAEEVTGGNALHAAEHWGTLAYGHKLGQLRLGAVVSLHRHSYELTEPMPDRFQRGGTLFRGVLGLGLDGQGRNSMDLALGFSAGSFADKITPSDPQGGQYVLATRMKSAPAWMVDLLARGTIEVAGGTVVIPYVNMAFGGEGVSWNTGEASAPENSGSHFQAVVGADLRIQPLEKVLIYPGVGVRYGRIGLDRNGEEMVNNWALSAPFIGVALDARMADWAFFRMGVRQSVIFSSTYNGIQRMKESGSTTDVSLGFGFRLGRVDLDLRINPALLTQGPQIVTGKTLDDGFAAEAGIRFMW